MIVTDIDVADPIVLKPGGSITATFKGHLKRDLQVPLTAKIYAEKKILWGFVKIPCIKKMGSW